MTKLTIQQQILSWLGMYRDNLPIEAVHKLQDLLELQPQEEKPAIMPIGNKMPADIFNNEQSILQKLRAELERLKEEWTYPFYNEYTKGQIETLCIVVSLLNELEKEQPPAPEELKLEKLPEYIARPEDMDEFSATYDVSETQLERLTTTVNLLIDKLNNK